MKKTYRLAPDYELEYSQKRQDLFFWVGLAHDLGACSILELGVGTGRVLFPVARGLGEKLKKAVGLDADVNLLKTARRKLHKDYHKIESRVELIQGDMRSFKLKDKFDFIFIPFNSLSMIYKPEDQLAVLKNVRTHLRKGGFLCFEVYAPKLDMLARLASEERITQKEFQDKKEKVRLVRERRSKYNPKTQVIDTQYHYRKYDASGSLIDEYQTSFKLYKFFPAQLRLLLKKAGFTIKHLWGDYEKNDFDSSSKKIIIVARK